MQQPPQQHRSPQPPRQSPRPSPRQPPRPLGESRSVQQVLRDLSETVHRRENPATADSPCGTRLRRSVGRYRVGSHVMAPGIDACSPRVLAEVVSAGVHSDRPGVWYVLREVDQVVSSLLLPEDALQEVTGPAAQLLWNL